MTGSNWDVRIALKAVGGLHRSVLIVVKASIGASLLETLAQTFWGIFRSES